jgi:effector-binding domain-containing protein
MSDLDVRIVTLDPMRVASARGFGESPEPIAWSKLLTWAESKGLLENLDEVRFFGFNNPNPSPDNPNYGYEQWITVGPDVTAEGDVEIKEFPGGRYVVSQCKGIENIGTTWQQTAAWVKENSYTIGQHQWLEECLTKPKSVASMDKTPLEDYVMELYCPIEEG